MLEQFEQSRSCFRRALGTATEAGSLHVLPEVLAGMAELLTRESQSEQAAELLGLILNHPASTYAVRERANRLLGEIASKLPAEVVEAAHERGAARELLDAVSNILQSDI